VADVPAEQESEPVVDPEVRALIVRAVEYVEAGRRLPRPATWKELLAGMVVWLGEHWTDEKQERRDCVNCGENDWEFGPVVSFDADARWPPPEGGKHGSFPYFQVGCRKCGNTMFINALSVFEPQASDPDTSP
jgi:hypothetical protein